MENMLRGAGAYSIFMNIISFEIAENELKCQVVRKEGLITRAYNTSWPPIVIKLESK